MGEPESGLLATGDLLSRTHVFAEGQLASASAMKRAAAHDGVGGGGGGGDSSDSSTSADEAAVWATRTHRHGVDDWTDDGGSAGADSGFGRARGAPSTPRSPSGRRWRASPGSGSGRRAVRHRYELPTASFKRHLDESDVRSNGAAGGAAGRRGRTARGKAKASSRFANPVHVHQRPPAVRCERVTVSARVRPSQKIDGESSRLTVTPAARSLLIKPPGPNHPEKRFVFDHVFGPETKQAEVLRATAAPLVDGVLAGVSGCLLAYGQTGAGKTYTIFGPDIDSRRVSRENTRALGLIPRAMFQLFEAIDERRADFDFTIRVQYLQVYMESVQDLLKPELNNLAIREGPDGWFVDGLSTHKVDSVHTVLALLELGARHKTVARTALNIESSRSHTVFTVQVKRKLRHPLGRGRGGAGSDDGSGSPPATGDDGSARILTAKLTFVDLAGSERTSRTRAEGVGLEEAKSINRSLSALGNVVSALAERSADRSHTGGGGGSETFVPWRDSKLTRLLQDSLAGNSRIHLILAVSPSDKSAPETVNTLLFGHRAQAVALSPTVNERVDYRALCAQQQAQLDDILDRHRQESSIMVKRYEELQQANETLRRQLADVQAKADDAEAAAEIERGRASKLQARVAELDAQTAAAERRLRAVQEDARTDSESREKLLEEALLEQVRLNEHLSGAAASWAEEREALTSQVERLTDALSHNLDAALSGAVDGERSPSPSKGPSPEGTAELAGAEPSAEERTVALSPSRQSLVVANAALAKQVEHLRGALAEKESPRRPTSELHEPAAATGVVPTSDSVVSRVEELERSNAELRAAHGQAQQFNATLVDQVTRLRFHLAQLAANDTPAKEPRPPAPAAAPQLAATPSAALGASQGGSVERPRQRPPTAAEPAPVAPVIPSRAPAATAAPAAAPTQAASQAQATPAHVAVAASGAPTPATVPAPAASAVPQAAAVEVRPAQGPTVAGGHDATLGAGATNPVQRSPRSYVGPAAPGADAAPMTPSTAALASSMLSEVDDKYADEAAADSQALSNALNNTRDALAKALEAITDSWAEATTPLPHHSPRPPAATAAAADFHATPPAELHRRLRSP